MADKYYGSGISLASGFDLGAKAPLDSRLTVNNIVERDEHVTRNRAYPGLLVYVIDEDTTYQFDGTVWKEFGVADYNDLLNKPEIPTKLGDLENDFGYATKEEVEEQIAGAVTGGTLDLSSYAEKEYVDGKIAELVDSTPETLDTLRELSEALNNDADFASTITQELSEKVDKEEGKSLIEVAELERLANITNYDDTELRGLIEERADGVFSADMNTVTALGGIKAGENLDGLTIQEVLTKLLYPYIQPTVSASITHTPSGSLFEKGTIVYISALSMTVTKKSEPISEIRFIQSGTVIESATEGVAFGGTFSYEYDTNIEITENIASSYFQAIVKDAKGTSVTANTKAISFVYPYYFGVVSEDTPMSSEVITRMTKKVESKGNKTHSYTTDFQQMMIAYPSSYGGLKSILDPNGFEQLGTFTVETIGVVCLDGTTQDYTVYRNKASTNTNFAMTFKY